MKIVYWTLGAACTAASIPFFVSSLATGYVAYRMGRLSHLAYMKGEQK